MARSGWCIDGKHRECKYDRCTCDCPHCKDKSKTKREVTTVTVGEEL